MENSRGAVSLVTNWEPIFLYNFSYVWLLSGTHPPLCLLILRDRGWARRLLLEVWLSRGTSEVGQTVHALEAQPYANYIAAHMVYIIEAITIVFTTRRDTHCRTTWSE
ncbi:hypothetical protein BW892_24525 [Bacillus cereus]|uniref:Uncharacterized protein n=1 Tax=Bacillus cereus TaxID=1396 RepID=A0A1S9UDC0_BACCE|nr:hypothetical protein BW892_24525 [Bacillus cereus]